MSRFTHESDPDLVIETSIPSEAVALRSQGFVEHSPFDPSEANATEAIDYLATIDSDPESRAMEVARVAEAERAGKGRKSVLEAAEKAGSAEFDAGGAVGGGPAVVVNDSGSAEAIAPAPKSGK